MNTKQSVLSALIGKTVAIRDMEKGYLIMYPSEKESLDEYIIIGVSEDLIAAKEEDSSFIFYFSTAHNSSIIIEKEN